MRGQQGGRHSGMGRRVLASVVAIAATTVVVGAGVQTASASIRTDQAPATIESIGALDAAGLLPGGTVQRLVTVSVDGLRSALTVTAQASSRLDTDRRNGLQLTAESCSLAWTQTPEGYSCAGALASVVPIRPVVGRSLLRGLSPGSPHRLRLTLSLPSTGGTDLLGQRSALNYRIGD